jgi:hypothetical protein
MSICIPSHHRLPKSNSSTSFHTPHTHPEPKPRSFQLA